MKTNLVKPLANRHAFTLVELIVVLTILVGLAGVLIPAVTDMIGRTNRSTSAINISEVAGAIQRYDAQFMTYPNNFDSLMLGAVTADLANGNDLNTLTTDLTGLSVDVTLTQGTLDSLAAAGITTVGVHASGDATFDLATPAALAVGSKLKGPLAATQVALGLETTGLDGQYIFLGVGALSDMNGKTMIDAPVHFPRNATTNPETTYARFIAIFQITDGIPAGPLTEGTPLTRAKFVGIVAPDGLGLSDELEGYFYIAANN